MGISERLPVIVGAVLAVFLQMYVAPYIMLFGAVPNVIVCFTMLMAVLGARSFGPVLPFVLGLLFDLFSGMPIGAMAFSLTAFSTLVWRFFATANNDTIFMEFVAIALGILLVELSYNIILMLCGATGAGFLESIVYRTLPCVLYDLVIAAVLYPLVARFLKTEVGSSVTSITRLR